MIVYLLPVIYFFLFGWFILKDEKLGAAGIRPALALAFLTAKIGAGFLYIWIMLHYIPAAALDIELFFGDGLQMYHQFWQDPGRFPAYLKEMFTITDFRIGSTDSDFIRTAFDGIKFVHFLLDFLSGGHLYTNILLFNCLAAWIFLRCWAAIRVWSGKWDWGAWLFLFPSSFFFTSVILKEGIEWVIMAAILPILVKKGGRQPFFRALWLVVLFALLFFFKYLIAATFVLALVGFRVYQVFPAREAYMSAAAAAIFVIIFFNARYLHSSMDLPGYMVQRRAEFQQLEANSALQMKVLEPTAGSFLKVLPEAVHNVLFRPWPGEGGKMAYLLFSLEIMAFWGLIFFLLFRAWRYKHIQNPDPVAWAFLLFSLVNLLIIGYTITNLGAILRYRSIFLPGVGYFFWQLCQGHRVLATWQKKSN